MSRRYQIFIESCDPENPLDPGNIEGAMGDLELLGTLGGTPDINERLTDLRVAVNRLIRRRVRSGDSQARPGKPGRQCKIVAFDPDFVLPANGPQFVVGDVVAATLVAQAAGSSIGTLNNRCRDARAAKKSSCVGLKGIWFADLLNSDPE